MTKIEVIKEPDCWRAVIRNGKKFIVIQEVFEDEKAARLGAAAQVGH